MKDAGIGIPPEKLPEMFRLFHQADHPSTRSEGGLGIGLAIVKSLVELHGGRIAAESEGPGKGSEFIVRLPAAKPDAATPRMKGPTAAGRTLRILVGASGCGQEEDHHRTKASGFDHHLVKPIDFEALALLLARATTV